MDMIWQQTGLTLALVAAWIAPLIAALVVLAFDDIVVPRWITRGTPKAARAETGVQTRQAAAGYFSLAARRRATLTARAAPRLVFSVRRRPGVSTRWKGEQRLAVAA